MYFRVGAGGAGYEIYVTTSDTSLYGVTLTLSKSGTTVGTAVVDNQGEAKFNVKETGTYTITFVSQGTTYTETVEVSAYEVEIEAGFQFKRWLGLTDLDPDDYASLADVLADEKAVRQLMTVHASVDYLASFTSDDTSVAAILNNDLAAKWITCTAYAEDILTDAYGALMESIGKYGYGKWVLQGQVPKMTSATAPYGTVSASSEFSSTNAAWKAFNESSTTAGWCPANSDSYGSAYLQYSFINPVNLSEVYVSGCSDESRAVTNAFEFRGSNDGFSTYDVIGTVTVTEASSKRFYGSLNKATAYSSVRMYMVSGSSGISTGHGWHLQFYAYAPLGNVPIMTSNTAPYGEANCDSTYNTTTVAYKAFNGDSASVWESANSAFPHYVGYKFANPICVTKVSFLPVHVGIGKISVKDFEVRASNDGFSTYEVLYSGRAVNEEVQQTFEFNNADYYIDYRLHATSSYDTNYNYAVVSSLQFYGRQMNVSVPKMTSNTAPYGEAIGDAEWGYSAVADGLRWRVFDKDTTTNVGKVSGKNTGTIGYKFPSPVVIREIYLYGHYSAGAQTIQLQGSNDGVTYENVGSVFTYNQSLAYSVIKVTNDTPYAYYLLNITGSTSTSLAFRELNFFGFDYSEKEWDTAYPRHYIYDNGVEVESLGSPVVYGSPTVEKKPYEILGGTNSGSNGYAFAPETAVDITPYNLMRMIVGDQAMGSSYTSNWGIKLARSYGAGDLTMIAQLSISTPISLELGLDVSNVDQSAYPMLAQATSGGSITRMSLTEWWLE